MIAPGRILLLACGGALLVVAAIACGAGDEIAYTASGLSGDGGLDGADDGGGGRIVTESGVEIRPQTNDGSPPAFVSYACAALTADPDAGDGGCDPTAGQGCCLPGGSSDPADNKCAEQVHFFGAGKSICQAANDVFLTCLGGDSDNICCWQPTAGGTGFHTRFRADCDGGVESCDPNGPGGGVCQNGKPCLTKTCKGMVTGACGQEPPCFN